MDKKSSLAVCCLFAGAILTLHGTAFGVQLNVVHWDDPYQRWRDIATNPYASEKKATYTYESAGVTIEYQNSAASFIGTLSGTALKPNFAYQIKLNGWPILPSVNDDPPDPESWASEQLGYAGRWWMNRYDTASGEWVDGRNSNDAEYESWKAVDFTDGVYDYVFEGYLLFDYFVTDASGSASLAFALDSSFHVLWKTSQRQPTGNDSSPTNHTVVANGKRSDWYARKHRTKTISIYAEGEPGRALPGQCALPAGDYPVLIFLTEESFHESQPDSGTWATVMGHDGVLFTVDGTPWPPEPGEVHVASIDMALKVDPKKKVEFTSALATVTIVDASNNPIEGATISGSWSNATSDTDSGVTDTAGKVTLQSDRVRNAASGTTFTFTVDNVVKQGWTYDSSSNVETSDSISVP